MKRLARTFLLALAAGLLLSPPAVAQLGRAYPGPGYFAALDELHAGLLRRAERGMRNELRTAVKTVDARWVDSIMFAAGLGEALYQQGRLAEALAQYDAAADLLLQHSDWLGRVTFRQPPRDDTAILRRLPAWARPARSIVYANMPRSFLYSVGQLDNSHAAQEGGLVQLPQFWKLDAEELARAIAWTLYRRGDLLGPLGAYDQRTKTIADRLAAGGLGQPGHWSRAWVELWWGLAEASRGSQVEASPHLERALRLGGRYDHRLSGIAWLAKAQMARGAGDPAALLAYQEAVNSSVAYEDIDTLLEALKGWATVPPETPGPRAPLAGVVEWSERRGYWLASSQARLLQAEPFAMQGDGAAAPASFRRRGDASSGLQGRQADRLIAVATAMSAPESESLAAARRAMSAQASMSRRLLQLALASSWYDEGLLAPRLAVRAFDDLLSDPAPVAWVTAPLDSLTANASPATDAFDRWFAAALERDDALTALRVIDQQRRREFFAAQPLGGRAVAVRWLLEAPEALLTPEARKARPRVDRSAPEYREPLQAGAIALTELRAALAASPGEVTPAIRRAADRLSETLAARERLVRRTALSRAPTPLAFPPRLDAVGAKSRLAAGHALLAFHVADGYLHGVVLAARGQHVWRIGPVKRVAAQVERLLRSVVGTSPKQRWSDDHLTGYAWQEDADELARTLFADSRLDAGSLERLWIVPDGPLWRAPLGLLPLPGEQQPPIRLADVRFSLSPTPGWATRERPAADRDPPERLWRVAVDPSGDPEWEGVDPLASVVGVTAAPVGLNLDADLLKASADVVVIAAGEQVAAADPLGVRLTPGKGSVDSGDWAGLPAEGARVLALMGLGGGHSGGGAVRRSRSTPAAGAPELHLHCALLAGGGPTLLIERWPTRGERERALVAEWLNGVDRFGAVDAWRRSVELAKAAPLDPSLEPRLDLAENDRSHDASHPVWWAGYYVID